MQAAVEHQPLDHVARAVGAPDPAQHAGAALAAADQNEIADARPAALHGGARAGTEDRLGHQEAALLLEHRDHGLVEPAPWPAPDGRAHLSLPAAVSSATGSASSRSVSGLSFARTCGLMPFPVMIVSPSGR